MSIRRIEDMVHEYSGRYQTWSLLQETSNTPYPTNWIQLGVNALALSDRHPTYHETPSDRVTMDNPNITMEEYIRLEEEKAPIVFNDKLTSEAPLCEPTVSSLNDEIDFRISFDESDDEDCTPMVSYFDDLDYFKDFEKEFPAIVYNDAQTSKSDLLTEPILNPQHIDEFNLKDETSLSKCDEEEQNVLNFNDLFPFNVIYPNDSKSDKDNDDDKVDIEHSSGDLSVKPLPDVINTDVGAYAHGSNKLLETSLRIEVPPKSRNDMPFEINESEEEDADEEETPDTFHDIPEYTSVPTSSISKISSNSRVNGSDVNQLTILLVTSLKQNSTQTLGTSLKLLLAALQSETEKRAHPQNSLNFMVAELKNTQRELPTKLQALPVLVSSVQKQLKTLDSLPSLLNKVTETLSRFATVVENALATTTKDVPSAGQSTASTAKGEKNTKDAETNLKDELVDLLGTNVVTHYHNKKLLFDKYCDKMLKGKKRPKITNCEVLTKKALSH
ncbi:hypothetical protein Tco_0090072 [Tanacetum coccineum]